MDLLSVLKNDHREVKDLFQKILKEEKIDKKKVATLCQLLSIHMELEEKLFYPELKRHRETKEMAEEAFLEHDEAKKMVRALKKNGLDNAEMKVKCEMLQLAINHHVDEEEGHVFPKAKKVLSGILLQSLGEEFMKGKQKRLQHA